MCRVVVCGTHNVTVGNTPYISQQYYHNIRAFTETCAVHMHVRKPPTEQLL